MAQQRASDVVATMSKIAIDSTSTNNSALIEYAHASVNSPSIRGGKQKNNAGFNKYAALIDGTNNTEVVRLSNDFANSRGFSTQKKRQNKVSKRQHQYQ